MSTNRKSNYYLQLVESVSLSLSLSLVIKLFVVTDFSPSVWLGSGINLCSWKSTMNWMQAIVHAWEWAKRAQPWTQWSWDTPDWADSSKQYISDWSGLQSWNLPFVSLVHSYDMHQHSTTTVFHLCNIHWLMPTAPRPFSVIMALSLGRGNWYP